MQRDARAWRRVTVQTDVRDKVIEAHGSGGVPP
jgi:hypothetical protein